MPHPEFSRNFVRDLSARTDGGHPLSSTTVTIIAVCCSVGGVMLGFVMWKLIRACGSKSAPLPPIQPLAHHREQRLQESDKSNRAHTWNRDSTLQRQNPSHLFTSKDGIDAPFFLSRHSSFQAHEIDTLHTSPAEFALPNPGFRSSWGTKDSSPLGSIVAPDEFSLPPLTFPSPDCDSQSAPTDTSLVSVDGGQLNHRDKPNPRRRGSSSRPLSAVSSRTSLSARNTIRGSPHGPYSNIQIVLPAPLGSQLQPYPASSSRSSSRISSREDLSSRNSYVDRWIAPVSGTDERDDNENPTVSRKSSSYNNTLDRQSTKGSTRKSSRSRSPFQRGSSNPPSSYPSASLSPPQLPSAVTSNSISSLSEPQDPHQQNVQNAPNNASSPYPPPAEPVYSAKPHKLSKQRP